MIFLFFILLIAFVTAQRSCGGNCFYSLREKTITIEVNGNIETEKLDGIESIDSIETLEITGNLQEFPEKFTQQFPSLHEVKINTEFIPKRFFSELKIEQIEIGKDVKMIEESVFDSCDKLETVNILSEEIEIKRNSFDGKLIDLIFNGKRMKTNRISSNGNTKL